MIALGRVWSPVSILKGLCVPGRPNVLFIVIDQLRADCVFGALAEHLEMPNLRALSDDAVRFDRHFSVTSPCGPSRVSLLSAQYAMNHRAVRNGTPFCADTPTFGTVMSDAGMRPRLYGYTDHAIDPRGLAEDDPRLATYEGLAPGFDEIVRLRQETDVTCWEDHLRARGYDVPPYPDTYIPNGDTPDAPAFYAAEDSDTAYLTDRVLEDLPKQAPGWCALVAYVRPHPPLVAPAPYNIMYKGADMPGPKICAHDHPFLPIAARKNPISSLVEGFPDLQPTLENIKMLRALYFGLATEVDAHIGRLIQWLKESDQYDDTLIVVTADHGETLGDFGLWSKTNYFDASLHVPLIIRSPDGARGHVVDAPSESIDVTPTILEHLGIDVPHSMDGRSLGAFLKGQEPENWREASFSEIDLGDPALPTLFQTELGIELDACNLAILRTERYKLVQFAADLPPLLFDMDDAGEAKNIAEDPDKIRILLDLSRQMLCHRMRNPDGMFSRTMVTSRGLEVGTA